jgi:uncharacterized membrane protein YfcA
VAFVVLFLASLWAGMQNALAGGGAFVTLPSLILTGMDARAANMTSTIALFPAQVAAGWSGRRWGCGAAGLSLRTLILISLAGGALGAVLLLLTSSDFFARLVPWLVLFATLVFAWGSFAPPRHAEPRLNRFGIAAVQFVIAVYGGYFGGGIGFMMLAMLTAARLVIRTAAATKNVLVAVINSSAVAIFVFSPQVRWRAAVVAGVGAMLGGLAGARVLKRVNERALRLFVVLIGITLTIALFLRTP